MTELSILKVIRNFRINKIVKYYYQLNIIYYFKSRASCPLRRTELTNNNNKKADFEVCVQQVKILFEMTGNF